MATRGPFQKRLGYTFKKPELLELALTHPSVSHELVKKTENNQRLEFLGDAVLQLIISAELYKRFPTRDEGSLSKARARLVNRDALAECAREVQLGKELSLSRGEDRNDGRNRPSALADAFEAVVGAIYLDGGFIKVKKFILTQFSNQFAEADSERHKGNPKGELQEILQGKSSVAPEYRLLEMEGPDHDRSFICAVRHSGRELARGSGKSKKNAEMNAAAAAIDSLQGKP
ncbi:MAG: ribonuclease III [Verrucomicrobiota bacterium]|jgi:ribonuclease-3|nr:ribonuclease III [Verrucomicrobiota bacterium]